MKVNDAHLAGSVAPGTEQAREAQRVEREERHGPATSRAGAGADRVELSALSRVLRSSEASRAERVAHLAREYQAGRYATDPAKISHAMVEETLQASQQKP